MNVSDLIRHFGSRKVAMQRAGASRQLFKYWETNGIPTGRQWEIYVLTNRKLKVETNGRRA